MATLTVTTVSAVVPIPALSSIYENADYGGDIVPNNSKTLLLIRNGTGSGAVTVTAISAGGTQGLTIQDPSVTVDEDETGVIGPFPSFFNNANGTVSLTYSGGNTEIAAITF
jgi:hypothetical protein